MPQGGESHKTIMTTVQTDITPVPLQMSKSNGRLSKGEGGEERETMIKTDRYKAIGYRK